jgi:hypothetical protein
MFETRSIALDRGRWFGLEENFGFGDRRAALRVKIEFETPTHEIISHA